MYIPKIHVITHCTLNFQQQKNRICKSHVIMCFDKGLDERSRR